jgi:hypothetical protein
MPHIFPFHLLQFIQPGAELDQFLTFNSHDSILHALPSFDWTPDVPMVLPTVVPPAVRSPSDVAQLPPLVATFTKQTIGASKTAIQGWTVPGTPVKGGIALAMAISCIVVAIFFFNLIYLLFFSIFTGGSSS